MFDDFRAASEWEMDEYVFEEQGMTFNEWRYFWGL